MSRLSTTTNLHLCFAAKSNPQLVETSFRHERMGINVKAVRGRTAGAHKGYSTFSWSPAVKALSLLFVEGAIVSKTSSESDPHVFIEGQKGSPASSLDYAIAKQPNWIFDMFGCDNRGVPNLRRLVTRTNPEQRRPGPVRVALNNNFLPVSAIQIVLDEDEFPDIPALYELSSQLKRLWHNPHKLPFSLLELPKINPKSQEAVC
jgi:hypothetical protein